jgi:hypothetical protein
MDTFFVHLKKSLVATLFILFAFVATYVPQDWNDIKQAHAGAAGGGATEWTQLAQFAQDAAYQVADLAKSAANIVQNTISAVQNTLTAGYTFLLQNKELVLDPLAWTLAKGVISTMLDSILDWARNGFQGSPAFVENIRSYLTEAGDQAVGKFFTDTFGDFICDPFELDIEIALRVKYNDIIRSEGEQPISNCSLSDITGNIEDFISGLPGSFDQGGVGTGWENWFEVTSNPGQYTPYGQYLNAEAGMKAAIINSKNEEFSLLDFGDGFLSGTVCETVHGMGSNEEDCFINKPGKIVQEALSFNIDGERQSLIAADEFDEFIAELIGILADKVLTGATGLFN